MDEKLVEYGKPIFRDILRGGLERGLKKTGTQ